jgi:hypothetical protein
MKTLEMLIEAETSGKTYNKDGLYYSNEKGFVGADDKAWKAYAFDTLNDLIHDGGHYSDGWKEVIRVSDDERVILRNLKGRWLARDRNGQLYCYTTEPAKEDLSWITCDNNYIYCEAFTHLFQIVQWEDNEPTLIADLLKG